MNKRGEKKAEVTACSIFHPLTTTKVRLWKVTLCPHPLYARRHTKICSHACFERHQAPKHIGELIKNGSLRPVHQRQMDRWKIGKTVFRR